MYIEISKVGFINKGAALMLRAILNEVPAQFPSAKFVMAPNKKKAPYIKRAKLGLYQKAWFHRFGVQWGYLGSIIPTYFRELFGIVLNREVDVILDASGFSYSDQLDITSTRAIAKASKKWAKEGTKLILLPQAFGPFESTLHKKYMATIIENSDLIFARDKVSYNHLVNISGELPYLKLAPDFTNLLDGIMPENYDSEKKDICIIPNHRMIEKTSSEKADSYVPFLINCAKFLKENSLHPFILIHEGKKDLKLAKQICKRLNYNIPIIQEKDPIKAKGIIGSSKGVIGSRYHGLVSALSQGIVSLGTGWSHKYKMLFDDYGFSKGLLNFTENAEEAKKKLNIFVDEDKRKQIGNLISSNSAKLKSRTEFMWENVFEVLETKA